MSDLETFEAFENEVSRLKTSYPESSDLLFRGQGDEAWGLDTTLQRRSPYQPTWSEYARLVRATLPAVQTLTNGDWHPPTTEQLMKWGSEFDQGHEAPPGYDYYVYLRHHGFPSPLLDWSISPYVAAYFAFRSPLAKRVAIFVYMERTGVGKIGSSDRPRITHLGRYVKSHPRHVLQQCEYTVCSRFDAGTWRYAPHEDVIRLADLKQDLVWKFTLPATERLKVLKRLDEYNLNAYSLFPTEDALLETVALREMEFRERHFSLDNAKA